MFKKGKLYLALCFNGGFFLFLPSAEENLRLAGIPSSHWHSSPTQKILIGAGGALMLGGAAWGGYRAYKGVKAAQLEAELEAQRKAYEQKKRDFFQNKGADIGRFVDKTVYKVKQLTQEAGKGAQWMGEKVSKGAQWTKDLLLPVLSKNDVELTKDLLLPVE
jgi:hypothetical protein